MSVTTATDMVEMQVLSTTSTLAPTGRHATRLLTPAVIVTGFLPEPAPAIVSDFSVDDELSLLLLSEPDAIVAEFSSEPGVTVVDWSNACGKV